MDWSWVFRLQGLPKLEAPSLFNLPIRGLKGSDKHWAGGTAEKKPFVCSEFSSLSRRAQSIVLEARTTQPKVDKRPFHSTSWSIKEPPPEYGLSPQLVPVPCQSVNTDVVLISFLLLTLRSSSIEMRSRSGATENDKGTEELPAPSTSVAEENIRCQIVNKLRGHCSAMRC